MAGIDRLTDLASPIASLEPRVDGTPLRSMGWLEVAAAMGALRSEGADLLRCLYLDDRTALRRTLRRLVVSVSGSAGLSVSMQHELAAVALQAFMSMRPCETCGGHGHVYMAGTCELDEEGELIETAGVMQECPTCLGDGADHVKGEAVREMLGVSNETWAILLMGPFVKLYREIRHWHEQAASQLARRMR